MPLETATYTSDLNVANPAHTDGLSQADSHMRLLKSTIKATFPNITGAVAATHTQLNYLTTGIPTLATTVSFSGRVRDGFLSSASGAFYAVADNGTASVSVMEFYGNSSGSPLAWARGNMSVAGNLTATGAYSGGTGQLVPIGGTLLWWDDVLPTEGGYAWANGQIIASANTVCPILLARWGTRFGGNGTTTMGVPDLREAVPMGKSTMGGVARRGLMTWISDVTVNLLGGLFGESSHTLSTTEIPSHSHGVFITDPGHTHGGVLVSTNAYTSPGGATIVVQSGNGGSTSVATTGITIGAFAGSNSNATATAGGGQPHANMQPTAVCNYIIRLA